MAQLYSCPISPLIVLFGLRLPVSLDTRDATLPQCTARRKGAWKMCLNRPTLKSIAFFLTNSTIFTMHLRRWYVPFEDQCELICVSDEIFDILNIWIKKSKFYMGPSFPRDVITSPLNAIGVWQQKMSALVCTFKLTVVLPVLVTI